MGEPPDMQEVPLATCSLEGFGAVLPGDELHTLRGLAADAAERLRGRSVWNVSSTARGGGVAEMLSGLLGYARGAGIDARWLVISGPPDFFRLTKRLHHALHGSRGDGGSLGRGERILYERVLHARLRVVRVRVRPGDVVVLHDPQTAGLAPALADHGASVIWRSHIGFVGRNGESARGWAFLTPYLAHTSACVFSHPAYIPEEHAGRVEVIPPSIDPFSAKNRNLSGGEVAGILARSRLLRPGPGGPPLANAASAAERVRSPVEVVGAGPVPSLDARLVVQVSRWDPLKDHLGVMQGLAGLLDDLASDVALVLTGPSLGAIPDDPEAAEVFAALMDAWRELPRSERERVYLAQLPMDDPVENALVVNALQRHAHVVVQKSLAEGFGLTVTEAMWKARPVVASAVGGISAQIEDGVSGVLLQDPRDPWELRSAVEPLLRDRLRAEALGRAARVRVRERFLHSRQLGDWARLLGSLEA
jgi:trehalose synthase